MSVFIVNVAHTGKHTQTQLRHTYVHCLHPVSQIYLHRKLLAIIYFIVLYWTSSTWTNHWTCNLQPSLCGPDVRSSAYFLVCEVSFKNVRFKHEDTLWHEEETFLEETWGFKSWLKFGSMPNVKLFWTWSSAALISAIKLLCFSIPSIFSVCLDVMFSNYNGLYNMQMCQSVSICALPSEADGGAAVYTGVVRDGGRVSLTNSSDLTVEQSHFDVMYNSQ